MSEEAHGNITADVHAAAARLLGVERDDRPMFEQFRNGLRSRAVLATLPDLEHGFRTRSDRVVAKLYKGNGTTPGSLGYQRYHRTDFAAIPALVSLADEGRVQRSLTGGTRAGVGPYAILEFVEGEELTRVLDRVESSEAEIRQLASDLLTRVWIPLWSAGLRFKDCHPGNFVVTSEGRLVMIDTEQMRKPARELLETPASWSRRDAAEAGAIARLPGLLRRLVLAAAPAATAAAVLRGVGSALTEAELPAALRALGRDAEATPRAHAAVTALLADLDSRGWFS